MLTDTNQLLTEAGSGIAQAAPDGWEQIAVVARGMGGSVRFRSTAYFRDGSETGFTLETNTNFAILDLRKAMYKSGTGTWYIAQFTIDASHQLETEFDYDSSPFGDDLDDLARDILREDQELFPRSPEHLPTWHPGAPRA